MKMARFHLDKLIRKVT